MLYASPFITTYSLVCVALLGLVMGSFLGCLAWRITHGESVLRGRSHCDECGHALGIGDLIPVFSWLAHHGKCKYCGARISAKHPISELLCATAYVTIVAHYGITLEAVEMLVFASALFVISLTDIEDYLVPNGAIVVAIAARIVFIAAAYALLASGVDAALIFAEPAKHVGAPADVAFALVRDSLIGGVGVGIIIIVIVIVMDKVLGKESMGGGDIKLFAVAGFYFGWQQCLFLVIVACIVGLVFAAFQMKRQSQEDENDKQLAEDIKDQTGFDAALERTRLPAFPFGPSIAIACWITMLFGAPVVNWYFKLF